MDQDSEFLGLFNDYKMILALLESASQAMIATDPRGHIVLANRRVVEMFGYTLQELLGAPIELLLPESKRAAHLREREEYMKGPHIRQMGIGMDLVGRRKDGTEFPAEVGLSYVGMPAGKFVLALVTNISIRKALEEQIAYSHKMEAVGRLAGSIAHDFNNMLTVMTGYNEMIVDALPATNPIRGYAEEIAKASNRATALVNQLLSLGRPRAATPQVIWVNHLVEEIDPMLRRLAGEAVEVVFLLSPNAGSIRADRGQLEQVVVNLVINSKDAMPGGGRITIETGRVACDEVYPRTHSGAISGDFAMIAVSDTGHGMDAETKRRIFEPFFTTKPEGKGTGLGLATVYQTVKQSKGEIWVHSEPDRGTVFKMYFPEFAAGEKTT